jgi:preprotein translocase subunit YajC
VLAAVVAQPTSGETGGFDVFGLLLPLALAFLVFTMFRKQRKAQQQVKEMRTQLEPGAEVMTQFGLFGTIVSIDEENNKAVLELSPGNFATVHTQALSKVVQQEPAAVVDEDLDTPASTSTAHVDTPTVPDDASSIDGMDRPSTGGSTAAGPYPGTNGPAGTSSTSTDRDALDPRDPGAKRDN